MDKLSEIMANDTLLISLMVSEFKPIYNDVLNRIKYLVRDDSDSVEVIKDRLDRMLLVVYATDDFLSDYYHIKQNSVYLKIPRNILRKHGIDETNMGPMEGWGERRNKVLNIIYNDAKIYGVLIHEVVHGLQIGSKMLPELRQKRREIEEAEKYMGGYVGLTDEKASNLEEIYLLKKRGVSKKEYHKRFYINQIRGILNDLGIYSDDVAEDKTYDMVEYIKDNADYKIDEYVYYIESVKGINREYDEYGWDRMDRIQEILNELPFGELKKLFFDLVRRNAQDKIWHSELLQFMLQNWDKVKVDRSEVPMAVWGESNINYKLVKTANALEDIGLFKAASYIDSILVKMAAESRMLEFGRYYVLREILSELYNAVHPRMKAMLGGDESKMDDRIEKLRIIFVNDEKSGFAYDPIYHAVRVGLPDYLLNKFRTFDNLVDLAKFKYMVSRDYTLRDCILHEMVHAIQNLKDEGNYFDYFEQELLAGYGNVAWEQEAIKEALMMGKKIGLKFDDLNQSLQYHLWNSFKERNTLANDLETIKYTDKDLDVYKATSDRLLFKISEVLGVRYDSLPLAMKQLKDYFNKDGYKKEMQDILAQDIVERATKIWDDKITYKKFSSMKARIQNVSMY